MEQMSLQSLSEQFDVLKNNLGIKENKYIFAILIIFTIAYASAFAPQLPESVLSLFQNTVVRLLFIFLIAYTANKNPTLSLMIAVAFLVTMNSLVEMESRQTRQFPEVVLNETVSVVSNTFSDLLKPFTALFQ